MCTLYHMYSPSLPLSPGSACSLYIFSEIFALFSPTLLIISRCTMVSDLVMYAPHVFDLPLHSCVVYIA